MPDVGTQLRTYFDEVAERITEEDVYLRATTDRGVPLPTSRFRPRPIAAAAMGFGVALTLVGVVLVLDRIFGAAATDSVGNVGTSRAPTRDSTSPWLFAPMIFGLGLLATGMISGRRPRTRTQGGENMQTIDRVESTEVVDDRISKLRKRNRGLGWLAGLLAVAVIGLGGWLIADLNSGSAETAPTAEIEQLLNDYNTAWNEADGAGYLSMLTDSYTIETPRYGAFTGPEQALNFEPARNGVQTVGDYTMIGTGPWWVTMASHHDFAPGYPEGVDSVSILKIVEENGALKIAYHKGSGPAFE